MRLDSSGWSGFQLRKADTTESTTRFVTQMYFSRHCTLGYI